MQITLEPGDASWSVVEPLQNLVYSPEVMATPPWRDVIWAHAEERLLLRDERGDLFAHVGLYYRDVKLDDAQVRVGGIGGVMTHPERRRQGLASAAMRRAAEIFRERGDIDFVLLVCEPKNVALYRGLGWRGFAGDLWVEQPKGRISFTVMGTMLLSVKRAAPSGGIIDLCGQPW